MGRDIPRGEHHARGQDRVIPIKLPTGTAKPFLHRPAKPLHRFIGPHNPTRPGHKGHALADGVKQGQTKTADLEAV